LTHGEQRAGFSVVHAQASLLPELLRHLRRDAVQGLTRSITAYVYADASLVTRRFQCIDHGSFCKDMLSNDKAAYTKKTIRTRRTT
jgi:hypothetical protein